MFKDIILQQNTFLKIFFHHRHNTHQFNPWSEHKSSNNELWQCIIICECYWSYTHVKQRTSCSQCCCCCFPENTNTWCACPEDCNLHSCYHKQHLKLTPLICDGIGAQDLSGIAMKWNLRTEKSSWLIYVCFFWWISLLITWLCEVRHDSVLALAKVLMQCNERKNFTRNHRWGMTKLW